MKRMFFEKNLLKVSIVSDSDSNISSFSHKLILPLETDLSEIKIFTVFSNGLFFSCKFDRQKHGRYVKVETFSFYLVILNFTFKSYGCFCKNRNIF